MTRPPIFPPPQFPPARVPLFARMPPAVFPTVMGLFGLGLALRKVPGALALADLVLGAVSLLWLFAAFGYAVKIARRPGVVMEDLAILPGRAGLAAASLGLLLLAATILPYAPGAARGLLFAGLALHGVLAALVILALARGPAEGRGVTPVWHLSFVGFIICGLTAAPLGLATLALVILWGTGAAALAIWGASLWQLVHRIPPAPLRPLLAIHLAPASLLGMVAHLSGLEAVAAGFAVLGGAILLALLVFGRWVTAAGFSPLWGAFTFPLAAWASLCLALGWTLPGAVALVAAMGIVPWVAFRVMQMWAKGTLAAKTNAATA